MELDLTSFLIICPLVFLGGLVDAVAGGGGLITLPAYLLGGLPPHLAIGTNKLSGTLGTSISTWRLWRAGFLPLRKAAPAVACALVGSFIGARIAMLVPSEIFELVLVGLLPIVAFALLSKRSALPDEDGDVSPRRQVTILMLSSLVCGAYDGFYGPSAGTFMLLCFTFLAKMGVRSASGTMKAVNLSSNVAAFVTFALSGQVAWALGLTAGLFGIAGNYIGAGLVLKNGTNIVRPIILVVISILFVKTVWGMIG